MKLTDLFVDNKDVLMVTIIELRDKIESLERRVRELESQLEKRL
jgi:hypothetical protein